MKRALLLAALLAAGCEDVEPVLVIDTIANCERATIETLGADLFPDAFVLGLAADGPDLEVLSFDQRILDNLLPLGLSSA